MADLTIASKPTGPRGVNFTQETWNSTDATSGVNLVPAKGGHIAVIDELYISFAGINTAILDNGTNSIIAPIYGAANSTVRIVGPIHCNEDNTAIDLTASTTENLSVFYRWHYESEATPDASAYSGSSN